MTDRQSLITVLRNYQTSYDEESAFRDQFLDLLEHPRCFHRDHLPGHITGSAWIVDEAGEHVLLTHHAKLNRWLQPGGHADGDENIQRVALRETEEETGLKNIQLGLPGILDIDIHTIPARKDFPEHLHYDIRILVRASRTEKPILTDESHDLAWININDIAERTGNNRSMLRMAKKVRSLF
jgi:8-oxo-dGTP pyrophosphatase MutT (NUDIX family)